MQFGLKSFVFGTLPAQDDSTEFTLAVYAPRQGASDYYSAFEAQTATTDYMRFTRSASNQSFYYRPPTGPITLGSLTYNATCLAVKRGLTLEYWVEGLMTSSTTASSGALNLAERPISYGQSYVGISNMHCSAAWAWLSRALSPGEIAMLATDPFCMLEDA